MELMENIGWQAGDSFEPASTNIRPKSLNFNKNSEGKQKLDLGNLGKKICFWNPFKKVCKSHLHKIVTLHI